jgi:hypothetical protein
MSKQIWLQDDVYERLEFLKTKLKLPGRKSVNAVIKELIDGYWNPLLKKMFVEETFDELYTKLKARGLLDVASQERLQHAKGAVIASISKETGYSDKKD